MQHQKLETAADNYLPPEWGGPLAANESLVDRLRRSGFKCTTRTKTITIGSHGGYCGSSPRGTRRTYTVSFDTPFDGIGVIRKESVDWSGTHGGGQGAAWSATIERYHLKGCVSSTHDNKQNNTNLP